MWRGIFQGKSIDEGTIQQGNSNLSTIFIGKRSFAVETVREGVETVYPTLEKPIVLIDIHVTSGATHGNGIVLIYHDNDTYGASLLLDRRESKLYVGFLSGNGWNWRNL